MTSSIWKMRRLNISKSNTVSSHVHENKTWGEKPKLVQRLFVASSLYGLYACASFYKHCGPDI